MASSRSNEPQTSVWLHERAQPARKAAPAGRDRDRIVAAAIRLLDADGLAKFSMRRLAAELGVSAMSVYWYVDNKDDLLEMALDAVSGEVRLPDPGSGTPWQDDVRQLAVEFRRVLVAHPWASRLIGEYLNVGPNSMELSTTALRVMDNSGLPRPKAPGALSAVYQFAYGYATMEGRYVERCRDAGLTEDEFFRRITDCLVGRPGFEEREAIMRERASVGFEEGRERDFLFGLDCVIAGIEVMAERYGGHR
ncbi:TetR/AcrR family transcriptional regulator C-terminal domain-containing protein [Wenjunlia tyrosinilytica]|uniref:TetR family transcriptional regulator n=1 Tax=Wenjunlia tyrosinilytica TaxID=1544741 RepID=A0A917ZPJ0_9ACTN|nr:TetR/AcrR family transcriptional regulator C-terminal domain-containing protein [Wenjunlia tyrosinilytica]GGO86618.1 TetR family transcriptional regulator [Wenjunlia tyrosinilytica]